MLVDGPSASTSPRAICHRLDERTLVDTGVLVRTRVLRQVVDIDTRLRRIVSSSLTRTTMRDASTESTYRRDGDHRHARVDRNGTLDAGTDERRFGAQRRHSLALHVRAHQRAVRVVVLEERNQRRRDRYDLARADVHVVDVFRRRQRELVLVANRHELFDELAVLVELGVRLRDDVLALLDRRQVLDVVGRRLAVLDLAVRRLEEAVLVGPRVHGQRVDQADVRAFRRLDRADTAVVRRVHVAHLEARALARQAARAERRYAAFVRHFRQRVVLVHELRQLARAEEFLDGRSDRLRVDHFLRHQAFGLGLRQALLDGALDANEADAERVLGHLADAAYARLPRWSMSSTVP